LKMSAPKIKKNTALFSWDFNRNTLIPDREPAFQWIDYVLHENALRTNTKKNDAKKDAKKDAIKDAKDAKETKRDADSGVNNVCSCGFEVDDKSAWNESFRIATNRPFPELSALWQAPCFKERNKAMADNKTQMGENWFRRYKHANEDYLERLALGEKQSRYQLSKFNESKKPFTPRHWIKWIRDADFYLSSQLWKGLDFYGFLPTDFNLRGNYYHPWAAPLEIGRPHGYRMICDASDHSAVLGEFELTPCPK
jgi:hypothetical protein